MHVGVDVGGTFTDVLVAGDDGTLEAIKTPSTPDAPEEGVVDGLRAVDERTAAGTEGIAFLSHATTVATNAVLEDEWADVAMVTTEGFRDVIEIGRQDRPSLYDFQSQKPRPVVPRRRRFEVAERIGPDGSVRTPLSDADARAVAEAVAETGVEAVVVCFLNAFEDPAHEREMAAAIGAVAPDLSVTLSSDVLPEIREYERAVTTAMSAGLQPVMGQYLARLEDALDGLGVPAPLNVMQSNGGVFTAETAREKAINTLLSGPAAGVQGAVHVGRQTGDENLITMDMGGTSCDVCLVPDGEPVRSAELSVGGYPVRIPMIDIHTIGNGGGSIAHLDAGGALQVGPASAGAEPGPVCYGRGGTDVTVTDAHCLLGRVDPGAFLGGDLGVDDEALAAAFEELCSELGRSPERVAQDILDVANANMERALGVISTERGRDPRAFTLVAFGGAGPLHAPALARELDIGRVLVPRFAGVLSALGLQVADTVYDLVQSEVTAWAELAPGTLERAFAGLEEEGRELLADAGVAEERREFRRMVDLRYVGQSFELSVDAPDEFDAAAMDRVAARFHDAHEQRYGHKSESEPLELVNVRVDAVGVADPPSIEGLAPTDTTLAAARKGTRPAYFGGDRHETAVYDRLDLPAGEAFDGPGVVEGPESTTVVHPDQTATTDRHGNLLVESGGGR